MLLLLVVAICVGICKEVKSPEHRMQWWLNELDWGKDIAFTGKEVEIAIIDTGVDLGHRDLKKENINSEKIGTAKITVEDNTDHGTAVAGIINAYPHDKTGLLGLAPCAKITSIDVTDDIDGIVKPENLAKGILKACEKNVDIINISIGIVDDYTIVEDAIRLALEKNIIVVASAGNYMNKGMLYPAKYSGVIAVGSKTRRGNILSPVNIQDKEIVYLIGENIVSTIDDNGYYSCYGTSFSAAIMSGIIALILEKNNKYQANEILEIFNLLQAKNEKITIPKILKEVKKHEVK